MKVMVAYDELHTVDGEDMEDWLQMVEKSFDFEFIEKELADVQTFGDLSDRIIHKFTLRHSGTCTTQQAFYKLRSAFAISLQVDSITPHTLLSDLLPRKRRRSNVKKLEKQVGFKLSLLRPPAFVLFSLLFFMVAAVCGFFVDFRIGFLGLLIPSAGFWLAYQFGKELTVKTVGDLAEQITREHYRLVRRDASTFNRDEIEKLLADWLCESFALSRSKLTREAKFLWVFEPQRSS